MERSDEARREDALYDRIGQLRRTNRRQDKRIKELEAENLNRPHLEPTNCPTYYDGCHCTVETLIHNIKRADKAEAENKKLIEGQKAKTIAGS